MLIYIVPVLGCKMYNGKSKVISEFGMKGRKSMDSHGQAGV